MKRSLGWIFGAYCGLAASEWLFAPVPLRSRCLLYAVIGVAAVIGNGRGFWDGGRDLLWLTIASGLMLGVPDAAASWALGYVSGSLGTVAMGFLPVVLVLVVAQEDGGVLRLLIPAVMALGGLLLLIPVSLPGSLIGIEAAAVLVGCVLLVAVAGVWTYRISRRLRWAQGLAVVCLANAAILLAASFLLGSTGWGLAGGWAAVSIRGMEILLLVALLRELEPVRLGARFLVVPLLALVEGFVLLHPELTMRTGVGAALLAGGAGFLLLARTGDEGGSLSLR